MFLCKRSFFYVFLELRVKKRYSDEKSVLKRNIVEVLNTVGRGESAMISNGNRRTRNNAGVALQENVTRQHLLATAHKTIMLMVLVLKTRFFEKKGGKATRIGKYQRAADSISGQISNEKTRKQRARSGTDLDPIEMILGSQPRVSRQVLSVRNYSYLRTNPTRSFTAPLLLRFSFPRLRSKEKHYVSLDDEFAIFKRLSLSS